MDDSVSDKEPAAAPGASVRIEYCTGCKWLLRAAWIAQEILSTFEKQIEECALVPASGGTFRIWCNGAQVWDRKIDGGFPEAAELKRRLRDLIAPEQSLGHCELPTNANP